MKNNLKDFVSEKPRNSTSQITWNSQEWEFLPQACDICGSDENPADPFLKCGYGWEDEEEKFCDNIICRKCRVEDRENKRMICSWHL